MSYTVYCIHDDRDMQVSSLREGVAEEVAGLGGTGATVTVQDGFTPPADPDAIAVAVYLGSTRGAASAECGRQVAGALAAGLAVLPCVDDLANFEACTPAGPLRRFNGMAWPGQEVPPEIVHFLLEALGLEEHQRMVFLSHRRSDALALAEQLHDRLIRCRFWPFMDRFDIEPAADVQQRIYAALEETAFVVLVESPEAATSSWVLEEVLYALRNSLGLLIVSFPGVREMPGTQDLPRFYLEAADLVAQDGQFVLADAVLGDLVAEIETIHARALVRRKRRLVGHARIAAERAGLVAHELPGDLLLVSAPWADDPASQQEPRSVVHFTPRPPRPEDLYAAETARARLGGPGTEGVLVHPVTQLSGDRSLLLEWCRAGRNVTVLADYLVGAHWQ